MVSGSRDPSRRYLLRSGSKRLVPLADELELLDQFLALVTIRYAGGLRVDVHVDAHAARRWQLPPVVLPELRENAVKHNELSTDNPLQIEVRLEGDRLTVSLERRPRHTGVSSTGVGLENLAQRFRLTTGVAALDRSRRPLHRDDSAAGGRRPKHCTIGESGNQCGGFCPLWRSPSPCCVR